MITLGTVPEHVCPSIVALQPNIRLAVEATMGLSREQVTNFMPSVGNARQPETDHAVLGKYRARRA